MEERKGIFSIEVLLTWRLGRYVNTGHPAGQRGTHRDPDRNEVDYWRLEGTCPASEDTTCLRGKSDSDAERATTTLHRMLPNLKDDLLLLATSRLLPFSTILDRRIQDRPVSYDDVEKKELL